MRLAALAATCLICAFFASPAGAGSDTDTFDVTITIQAGCEVSAPNDLAFGTHSFLDTANIDSSVDFSIRCTNGTGATIALDDGLGGGTVALRTMELGAGSVNYTLYADNTYSQVWGDGTLGTSTEPYTGTGSTETLTIFGRVPTQATPASGTYTDTITITVTF
jgi:spore coat protein U-like protein